FSDIQADIAQALIKAGVEVWISNHRSVAGILGYVRRLGAMVGAADKAEQYARSLEAHVAGVRDAASKLKRRPRVYFEEWDEPQTRCIRWGSEPAATAAGEDICPEPARSGLAKGPTPAAPGEAPGRRPHIIIGSWCGKKFRPEKVSARPGYDAIPAVRDGEL